MADTPLGITTSAPAFAPGVAATGRIIHPDGTITVSIAPAAARSDSSGRRVQGAQACDYRSGEGTFACPTDDLEEGLYVVEARDAAQPGEGTVAAQVAVTPLPDYRPAVAAARADGSEGEPLSGEPATLELSGWRPNAPVRVEVTESDTGKVILTTRAVTGPRGEARLATPPLRAGTHEIEATDGLWTFGATDGDVVGSYVTFYAA